MLSGYNFQCDMKQLSHSYEELKCFKHYESLLDMQQVFKSHHGGLAGLAEVFYVLASFQHLCSLRGCY